MSLLLSVNDKLRVPWAEIVIRRKNFTFYRTTDADLFYSGKYYPTPSLRYVKYSILYTFQYETRVQIQDLEKSYDMAKLSDTIWGWIAFNEGINKESANDHYPPIYDINPSSDPCISSRNTFPAMAPYITLITNLRNLSFEFQFEVFVRTQELEKSTLVTYTRWVRIWTLFNEVHCISLKPNYCNKLNIRYLASA